MTSLSVALRLKKEVDMVAGVLAFWLRELTESKRYPLSLRV